MLPAAAPAVPPDSAVADAAATPPACRNCGQAAPGAYCGHCGQDTATARFTVRSFLNKAFLDALDIHHGLLFTAIALTRRPGPAIRAYVTGRRVHHYNPVKYFLLAFTLSVAVDEVSGAQPSFLHAWLQSNTWLRLAEIPLVLLLLVLYGMSFALSYRMVKGQLYNVPETLCFLFYTMGHVLLVSTVLLLPVTLVWPTVGAYAFWMIIPVYLAYQAYAAVGFYSFYPLRAIETALLTNLRIPMIAFSIVALSATVVVPLAALVYGFRTWRQQRV